MIDASGSRTPHIRRPDQGPVAGQAAYGVVGRFSKPPIAAGRFVLMTTAAITSEAAQEPPTFLYAMDLAMECSSWKKPLALAPGVPYDVLSNGSTASGSARCGDHRSDRGVLPRPMNLPLPDLSQPVLAFGGAASMVHPASGYMVGSLLRRASLAEAVAEALAIQALAQPP